MPPFSEWGPAEDGFYLAESRKRALALQDVTLQKEQQEIATSRAVELQRQQTASKLEQTQRLEQQKAQQLQAIGMQTQGKSLLDRGMALMDAGYMTEGSKLLEEGSKIESQMATSYNQRAAAEKTKFEQNQKTIEVLSQAVAGVQDDAGYQRTLDLAESMLGQQMPPQIRNARWSPELKNMLGNFMMSMKDRQELARKVAEDRSQAALRGTEMTLNQARAVEATARAKLEGTRAEVLMKNEGKNVARTPKEDMAAALNMMQADDPNVDTTSPGAMTVANSVAARAQQLLRDNRTMDRATALNRAYQEARASGDIKTAKVDTWFGLRQKDETTFRKPGEKTQVPTMPKSQSGQATANGKITRPAPAIGTVQQGYRYKGGDPASPSSWEKL